MKYYSVNTAFAAAMVLIIVMLAGCAPRTGDGPEAGSNDPVVYKDRATGCQYLAPGLSRESTLTRRTAADGVTHRGCGEVAK